MAVGQQYDRRHFILKSTYMATIRKQVTEEQEGKLNDIVKNSVDEVKRLKSEIEKIREQIQNIE